MYPLLRKQILIVVCIIAVLGIGGFVLISLHAPEIKPTVTVPTVTSPQHEVIGHSVQGRDIETYSYGTGTTHLVFVGGIHGGYEWNSVLLAYNLIDYLTQNPTALPANLTVTIIPDANPDAVYKVTGKVGRFSIADVTVDQKILTSARFNADNVDLNRNFDCKWQPTSTWQSKTVSAGTVPFSEPEAQVLRDYLLKNYVSAAIFWHSQSNAVYASQCEHGILPGTLAIMNAYAKAAGYPAVKTFDAYTTTGAADDWLASQNIPAITVELSTHNTIEWSKNLAGIKALFLYFGKR